VPPEPDPADPNERFQARRAVRRRTIRRRRTAALVVLLLVAALIALGVSAVAGRGSHRAAAEPSRPSPSKPKPRVPRALPDEVRGVHLTMSLASLEGKLDEYLAIPGLNTIELDVKDENGRVGFRMPAGSLARRIGAARPYYRARLVAERAHAAGVYLIGRVVAFEDPILSAARPDLAIQLSDGSPWHNYAGLGWANPYDRRVWDYEVAIGEAAARAGFDEIQFDYVRFPSDGPIESAVFPRKRAEAMGWTIARFVHYASRKLKPLGVRVSVDVFGLSATRDLGIGQVPGRLARYVDAVYPMVYPSHFSSGEYNLPDPSATPGRTVALSLQDFHNALLGRRARLIPWLEDFSLTSAHRPPEEVRAQIDAARRLGTKGFLLWNPEGVYTEQVLK